MKKALTFTVVSGSKSCPNDCPICISKMTPDLGITHAEPHINWQQFDQAARIAVNYNARYFLITSKGEASYHPAQVTEFLHRVEDKPFDRRELQTEGSVIARGGKMYGEFLRVWKDHGLDIIAVSIYHYDNRKNSEIFCPKNKENYELEKLIDLIHNYGLKVRLSCVMLKGYVDRIDEIDKLIEFSKNHGVFQLTLRRADRPAAPLDAKAAQFVDENRIASDIFETAIKKHLDSNGTLCDILPHGALVYEIRGQNVAITTGLSAPTGIIKGEKDSDELRQLIFMPPDILTTSWENVFGGRIL